MTIVTQVYKGVNPSHLKPNTEGFTHNTALGRTVLWLRLNNSPKALDVVEFEGSIDVYHAGDHVARWLTVGSLLWYKPDEAQAAQVEGKMESPEEYPIPNCPDCGAAMRLRPDRQRSRADSWFWGCPAYFGPRRCPGKIEFEPLAYDLMRAGGRRLTAMNFSLARLAPQLEQWRKLHAELSYNSRRRREQRARLGMGVRPPVGAGA